MEKTSVQMGRGATVWSMPYSFQFVTIPALRLGIASFSAAGRDLRSLTLPGMKAISTLQFVTLWLDTPRAVKDRVRGPACQKALPSLDDDEV